MKKVITFSLWGSNPTYCDGAIINAKLAADFFPSFECWIYVHQETVPNKVIDELLKLSNVKIYFKSGDLSDHKNKPMMWRFEAIDSPDVELMLSRDTDTRFTEREKIAVDQWINSSKKFHIMRDHPHHEFKILGGMFGTKKLNGVKWGELISLFPRTGDRDYDQKFLEEKIYPIIKQDALIHTSFYHYEGECHMPFPSPYSSDYRFVGEYIYHDDSRSIPHLISLLQASQFDTLPNTFTPNFPHQPLISIVIGTYQRIKFLPLTIGTLRKELGALNYEIIVVDGGSTDGTIEWLASQKDIITIIQHNRGSWNNKVLTKRSWGYFMNLAFKSAQGKYICMLSDDCIVVPKSIINGLNLFERCLKADLNIGGVAFYWRNWPTQDEYVVGQTWGDKIFINHGLYLNKALQAVGYADESNYSFYHADGDLSLKMWQAGFLTIDSPNSYIEHYVDPGEEVRTSNLSTQPQDWKIYTNKWRPIYGDATQDWLIRHHSDPTNSAAMFERAIGLTPKKKGERNNSIFRLCRYIASKIKNTFK